MKYYPPFFDPLITYAYLVILGCSALFGLLYSRWTRALHLKVYAVLLGITFGVEVYSKFSGADNAWLYNVLVLFEFIIYAWIISAATENRFIRNAAKIFFFFFATLWVLTSVFNFKQKIFNDPVMTTGSFFIVFLSICYYYQLLRADKPIALQKNAEFWIITGLLTYYGCTIPIFGLFSLLYGTGLKGSPVPATRDVAINLLPVLRTLAALLYLLITYAFLCNLRIKNFLRLS